jgi:hypothetical protein
MSKSVNFRLDDDTLKSIDNFHLGKKSDRTQKLKEIVNSTSNILRYTKKELINYFTVNEVRLILESLKNINYDSKMIEPKTFLYNNIENSIVLEKLDIKFEVDKELLLKNISSLVEYQAYTIIKMTLEYDKYKNIDIDEDIEVLKKIFTID